MSKRVNEFAETQKALRESEEARAKKREEAAIKEQQARQEFENNYHLYKLPMVELCFCTR